jgi:(E)-4-hydroxy-3-methylbut-2-enyl-diphosphate synthase
MNHVDALVQAARYWVSFFEDNGFFDIVISAKSSSPLETIEVYELLSKNFDYPLHLGLTEAGSAFSGSIRSAASLAVLLYKGIGDTIRISLSGSPVYEVRAANELLKSLGLKKGPVVISCPTCARTRIDVERLARKVERMVSSIKIPIKIAVMGCEVNGPGEAREADLGLAGTKRGIMIFEKGSQVGVYDEKEASEIFMRKIEELADKKRR